MLRIRSLGLFFLLTIQVNAEMLDENDKNQISNHFNSYIENGDLPNISILIKKNNKEIYRHTKGFADIGNKVSVNKTTVYRIYSMT